MSCCAQTVDPSVRSPVRGSTSLQIWFSQVLLSLQPVKPRLSAHSYRCLTSPNSILPLRQPHRPLSYPSHRKRIMEMDSGFAEHTSHAPMGSATIPYALLR